MERRQKDVIPAMGDDCGSAGSDDLFVGGGAVGDEVDFVPFGVYRIG